MPEFDILVSPAVDQLTTDPLVELNGITYVLASAYVKCLLISMYMLSVCMCVFRAIESIGSCSL